MWIEAPLIAFIISTAVVVLGLMILRPSPIVVQPAFATTVQATSTKTSLITTPQTSNATTCPNGSPTDTWTLYVVNKSSMSQRITVDGKAYNVAAKGTIEIYLSLVVAHKITVGSNTLNMSNDVSCGKNTLNIGG